MISNWKRNVLVYKIDSFFDWFYVPIGVWVLVWSHFLSFAQISMATGIGLFWGTLMDLPSGALADMVGRKKTVIMGRLICLIGYIFLFFRHDLFGLIIWNLCNQTDSAFTSGANSALIYDSLKENGQVENNYKKAEADTFMYNTIGMAIAAIIGGFLFKINPMAPYTAMIPIVLVALIASSFYDEPAVKAKKMTMGNYFRQNWEGIKHVVSTAEIKAVAAFTVAVNVVALSGVWYLYEPRLAAGGFDPKLLATLVSGTYVVRAIGTKMMTWVDSKIEKKDSPIFLATLQTVGSALSFVSGKIGAILCIYTRRLSDGYRQPTLMALQNEQIKSEYRATSLSAISLMTTLIVAILGIGVGSGIDKLGAPLVMGMYAFFGILVVIPAAMILRKRTEIKYNEN